MTYRQVKTVTKAEHENGAELAPLATLESDIGVRYHIADDDHCYVIYREDAETGLCKLATHIFPELFDVLREMPPLCEPEIDD